MDHSFSSWDPGEVADADNNYDEDSGDDDDDEDDDVDDDDDDDDDDDYDDDDDDIFGPRCSHVIHPDEAPPSGPI